MMKSRTRKILVSNYKCRGGVLQTEDWGIKPQPLPPPPPPLPWALTSWALTPRPPSPRPLLPLPRPRRPWPPHPQTTLSQPSPESPRGQWGGSPHPQTTLSQPQLQVSYSLEVSGEDHPTLTLLFFNLHQSLLLSYLKYSLSNCSRIVIKFY